MHGLLLVLLRADAPTEDLERQRRSTTMSILGKIGAAVRRKFHEREIAASRAHFEQVWRESSEAKQSYADTGSFRSHVDRLFALGNATETEQLKKIAESAVMNTVTNRYYRAADYLSDILDELERHSYLTGEPNGEPPLGSLNEGFERELKLKAVSEAWLVPLKVGAIESAVANYSKVVGRVLPYAALQRFERNIARLFAIIEPSERKLVEDHVRRLLDNWRHQETIRERFPEPADGVTEALVCLCGDSLPSGAEHVQTRRPDAPLRLATAAPEGRGTYLLASLARWEP